MADLRNSQRISYKATYRQISPTATTQVGDKSPIKSLTRAIDKAAFVQSLHIMPQELKAVHDGLSRQGDRPRADAAATEEAFAAIEKLVTDGTVTSTLRNASRFATINPSTLVVVVNTVIAHRQTVADAIHQSLADILSAYRASVTPRQLTSSESAGPTAARLAHATPPKASITDTGIPVLTTTAPAAPIPTTASVHPNFETRGYTASVTIDESQRAPASFSSVLTGTSPTAYTPRNREAMAWAEINQPALFARLAGQLEPYMAQSASERVVIGNSTAITAFLTKSFAPTFGTAALSGAVAGFQSRMEIEPIGNLHLERVEMYPVGVQRGELVHSVPLAPSETVNISHKEWSVSEKEFEDIVQDVFEGYSEQGVAEKTDIAMANDSQSQHATALNVGASLSASYSSVTVTTSFGYNATTNDSESKKDSRNHSMAITKKAAARTKKDHKVTFKVTSVIGSEDQSIRVISNPSNTDSMRIDYFQLARKWKVHLLRYGLRMTYDIVIPNPGSSIFTLVEEVQALDAKINTPFAFRLPLSAIYYNSLATNPTAISNYDQLAAEYNATVTSPPESRKWVNVHKETAEVADYDHVHFDSVEFDIDDNYYIYQFAFEFNAESNQGETRDFFTMLGRESLANGMTKLIGESGHLSIDFVYQYIYNFAINITFTCRPKVQTLLDWRLQVWNQIRQAAQDEYDRNIQSLKDRQAQLVAQIASFDALTLRRMEQEEIMKGVLRWLLGPQFYLVPFNISSLFGSDTSDPGVLNVLDPNSLSDSEWLDVMERGEFIKYIHNAIEWENVLYFTYPYFWDDTHLWELKKFLYHPDATHRTFLRSGAARVVLTIRPGFEPSFTNLVESGSFGTALPGPHPYVTIAQEIQDFAKTNYPGFPPANPEQNARPLLYLEQRRVWREMQFIVQLLDAFKGQTGAYPSSTGAHAVPAGDLTPYLDGPVLINGANYNGINDYNTKANSQLLALDPATPQEALLPTYTAVPVSDLVWNNPYFYKCPGDTGDYDLICFGADGTPGGLDKNADISANAEASLIATWYEYTPIGAMDIGVTVNQPNVVPPEPSPEIA